MSNPSGKPALIIGALAAAAMALSVAAGSAEAAAAQSVKNIVLVHDAFAEKRLPTLGITLVSEHETFQIERLNAQRG